MISPQYSALVKLSWWTGDEAALRLVLLEVVRANDHDSFLSRYSQWCEACFPSLSGLPCDAFI